jgi:hypothetical protein
MKNRAICIACGCDEDHACLVAESATGCACWWLRFDATANVGVCSACEDFVKQWDHGVRVPYVTLIAERFYRQVMFLYQDKAEAVRWMFEPQKLLRDRSPRQLILIGRLHEVQALLDQLRSGAFA